MQEYGKFNSLIEDMDTPHDVKIASNAFMKGCKNAGVPAFLVFFMPGGKPHYEYTGIFPPEIGTPDVMGQTERFNAFLRLVMNFDKEDYYPHIKS